MLYMYKVLDFSPYIFGGGLPTPSFFIKNVVHPFMDVKEEGLIVLKTRCTSLIRAPYTFFVKKRDVTSVLQKLFKYFLSPCYCKAASVHFFTKKKTNV